MSVATTPAPLPSSNDQPQSTFQHRVLEITFQLGKGSFGNSGFNTLKVSGLRASATIRKVVGASSPAMELVVYGLTLDVMNQLTTVGKQPMNMRNNTVTVSAGYVGGQMAIVFQGFIYQAFADFSGSPETALVLTSTSNGFAALKPIAPTSFKGSVDVAVVLSQLAAQMAVSFENNGVSVILRDPYFWGTAWQQAQLAADEANINIALDLGILAIWPMNGSRGTQGAGGLDATPDSVNNNLPIVSAETGMIGYPRYTDQAISVMTLFNPSIGFAGNIQVKSILTPANGVWTVISVTHQLESETPHGQWFTYLECSILGGHQLASQ